jgi:23S rRNA (guanosine2251-2'-O)-methyltransferase
MKTPHPRSKRPRPSAGTARNPDRSGVEWLSGQHSVHEALRAGRRRIERLLVREGGSRAENEGLIELARRAGAAVEWADERTLERVCGPDVRAQGVALAVGPLPELELDELIGGGAEAAASGRRLLVLDGVEDPQNVGAIARVAESAGCAGMILADRRAPPLTPAVSRASAGAIEWLPVARVTNLVRALEALKAARFWVLGATLEQGQSLYTLPDRILTGDLVVILGAEGKGIRPGVLEQVDHRVRIPMRGAVDSLNVSTAGAVILYELLRRAESGSV